ncbi:MAG: hypothetical protein LBO00_05355 [Zoogloeaceae bacterium]|jgi:hypothetical protein|nr:hypothetical protein [Zoogloeaceae bacterium]
MREKELSQLAALKDPDTPVEVLVALAEEESLAVRYAVALHPKCPQATLEKLAKIDWMYVGALDQVVKALCQVPFTQILKNPAAPFALLAPFLMDEYYWADLAAHPDAEPEYLEILSWKDRSDVREAVAANLKTPAHVLARLAADDWETDKDVRDKVAENPSVTDLPRLVEGWRMRLSAAENPETPADLFRKLAEDPDSLVRLRVAGNPSAPADALARIVEQDHRDMDISREVAGNPAASADALVRLAQSDYQIVRITVAENPSVPADVLARLAQDSDAVVRWKVARNPSAPVDLLKRLAEDPEAWVRQGVAENPRSRSLFQ